MTTAVQLYLLGHKSELTEIIIDKVGVFFPAGAHCDYCKGWETFTLQAALES